MIALLRFLTGGLFIFSGLIKANDPLGFGYKLEEYFVVFGMDFLNPLATGLAIAICVLEVVLGMALWVGWKTKAVTWWLLGMVVFFTFLTFLVGLVQGRNRLRLFWGFYEINPLAEFFQGRGPAWDDIDLVLSTIAHSPPGSCRLRNQHGGFDGYRSNGLVVLYLE